MRARLASGNPGKLAELRALFRGSPLELDPPLAGWAGPEESGRTYADNARLKARALAEVAGGWALADDSGLEADGLGGAPGVRSARFAGEGASDADNVRALLAALAGRRDRRARFRCVLALAGPAGELVTAEGVLEGAITDAPRGSAGFGYDPVFVPAGETRTLAELSAADKNRFSHRARAALVLLARLP